MKLKHFIASAVFAILAFLLPVSAQAAQKNNITLKQNTTYTKYDITGDGKADRIRVNFKSAAAPFITINGKDYALLEPKYPSASLSIKLYTLNGNKQFLQVKGNSFGNDHIDYDMIFQYKSGKIQKVSDLMSHRKGASNCRHNSYTHKIGNDYIQFRIQSMPYGFGSIQYVMTYKLSGNNLKLSSTTYPVTSIGYYNPVADNFKFWSTSKRMSLFDMPSGNIIHTVDKYAICTIKKVRYYQGNAYIYITDDDSSISGWIKCPNKYTSKYFLESFFI